MPHLSLVTFVLLTSSVVDSAWISHSDNTMPREDTMLAVGNYNNIIYLLGGFSNKRQMTQYNISSDSFIFFKSEFIPNTTKVSGEAQFWTQMRCNLYILDDSDIQTKLVAYNMANNEFHPYHFAPIVSDGMGRACITSHASAIYINGGVAVYGQNTPLTNTYILNLNTLTWLQAAHMNTARRSHSCIVHPNNGVLYSFGGNTIDAMTSTVERISTVHVNIHNSTWTYLAPLSKPLRGLRSFIHAADIIIIGGLDASRNIYDLIHVIHTIDDTVELLNNSLRFATVYSAAIMVDNIMYSFAGGFGENGEWQSQKVHTEVPTTSPSTTSTTTSTTDVPTVAPTVDVHVHVRASSTFMPSIAPIQSTFFGLFSSTIVRGNDKKSEHNVDLSATAIGMVVLVLLLGCVMLLCCVGLCVYTLINNRSENESKSFSKMSDHDLDVMNEVDGNIIMDYMDNDQDTYGMYTSLRTDDMDMDMDENGKFYDNEEKEEVEEELSLSSSCDDIDEQVAKFLTFE